MAQLLQRLLLMSHQGRGAFRWLGSAPSDAASGGITA